MKRPLPLVLWIVLLLIVAAFGLSWYVLSAWVPTQGKARLIQELERRTPLSVTIAEMRYDPLRGALARQVLITDHRTGEQLARLDYLQLQIGWVRLLLSKSCPFSGRATFKAPAPTELTFSGSYGYTTQDIRVSIQTTDIAVERVVAPLNRYVPKPLTGGSVRVQLELRHRPGAPLYVTGRAIGRALVWRDQTWAVGTDLTAQIDASRPEGALSAWDYEITSDLRQGILTGLPVVETLKEIHGTLLITPQLVTIRSLEGEVLGFPWQAEGAIALTPTPAFELLITSRVDAKALSALPAVNSLGTASGTIGVRAVCRGPLVQVQMTDCLALLMPEQLEIESPAHQTSVSRVTGRLLYDHLARTVQVEELSGMLGSAPAHLSGLVRLKPLSIDLTAQGRLPLKALETWLPSTIPVGSMQGVVAVDGRLRGPQPSWQATGRAEIDDASIRLTAAGQVFTKINGVLEATDTQVTVTDLAFEWREQPMRLNAACSLLRDPRIAATLTLPSGEIAVQGDLLKDAFLVRDGRIALAQSRAQVRGRISRAPGGRSQLLAGGILQLEELDQLPWLSLPQIRAWELRGPVDLQVEFDGALKELASSSIVGRAHAPRVSVKQLPIEEATCQFEQSARGLRIRLPSALIAGGEFKGDFTLERRAEGDYFLTESEVTGLQLAQLAQLVPAWKTRHVDGAVSAHSLISGTWAKHATWRGEGWVNAAGEQLGDVPLLDTVLRGLFGVLGDRLGLDALRRAQITQATVKWQLTNERFHTDNLRLGGLVGAEPMAIYGTGSVGLDQTLDFVIDPELSEASLLQAPTTSSMTGIMLKALGKLETLRRMVGRHRLTGTITQPIYRFEIGQQELLKEVDPSNPAGFLQDIIKSLN